MHQESRKEPHGQKLEYARDKVLPEISLFNNGPLEVDLLLDEMQVEQLKLISLGQLLEELLGRLSKLMNMRCIDKEHLDV